MTRRGSIAGSKDRDGDGELGSFGGGHVAELAREKNCRAADDPLGTIIRTSLPTVLGGKRGPAWRSVGDPNFFYLSV